MSDTKKAYLISVHHLNDDKVDHFIASLPANSITQHHRLDDPKVYATVAEGHGEDFEDAVRSLAAFWGVQALVKAGRLDHLSEIDTLRQAVAELTERFMADRHQDEE